MKMLFLSRKWFTILKLSTGLALVLFFAACGPSSEVLPTAIDLNAISTDDAATRTAETAVAAAATATRDALATLNAPPTLPPTWTPAPPPTEPPPQTQATLPPVENAAGTIYYIFNGDSIAMVAADGSAEELILVGGAPADLVLSPDAKSLAYTAALDANVREVFIMSLNTQDVPPDQQYRPVQVTCLGYARAILPAWTADGRLLAFAASQAADGPLGIYTVDAAGQCPVGNHQRGLAQTQFDAMTGVTWNVNNTQIYFASGAIYAVDAASGTLFPPLTQFTGYGPDFAPEFRPDSTNLYYLKTERDEQTTITGGVLSQVDIDQFGTFPLQELRSIVFYAQQFHFSRDGRYLVASGAQDASVQNMDAGSAVIVVQGAKFPPRAVFSPDAETIAYVDAGAGPNLVQQIWVVDRRGSNRRQLTNHKEGTITNMNWAVG